MNNVTWAMGMGNENGQRQWGTYTGIVRGQCHVAMEIGNVDGQCEWGMGRWKWAMITGNVHGQCEWAQMINSGVF
ncbi:hypothetical protein SESBI_41807 [Sesbania bispinosa]|nr:hypothetical protein SESBI_41807 [Sesbania bispinosa]